MAKIKIIRISDEEKIAFKSMAKSENKSDSEIESIIKEIDNQTLFVLRSLKAVYEWDDIEDAVDFVAILKKMDTNEEYVDLDKSEVSVVIRVMEGSIKSKKINGAALEKFVSIYETFNN